MLLLINTYIQINKALNLQQKVTNSKMSLLELKGANTKTKT